MLGLWRAWRERQEHKKLLIAFYAEVNKNLEGYYVMFQLGRLRLFQLELWDSVKTLPDVTWTREVRDYVTTLQEYNRLLLDFQAYEKWYAADINNKTPDNARILHGKKDAPQSIFQGLEAVIRSAQTAVEKELKERSILKV